MLASVYYEYVERLAKFDGADFELPIVLGCVIAHEIGHLLLGSDSHSRSGIMQARWGRDQLRMAMMGTLHFQADQVRVMRAEAGRRMEGNALSTDLSASLADHLAGQKP